MPVVVRNVLIGVAVVAAVAGAAAIAFPTLHPASEDRFVADVPWSSAVVASSGSRIVTVSAHVEGMDDRFACGPIVKPTVSETSRTVTIGVEVDDRPLPPGTACGGSGLITVPATVRLAAPFGTRALRDAKDGRTHRALVVDRAPAPSGVPAPFVRRSTGWDEATGQIFEWWRWQRSGQAQQLDLELGPASSARRWGAVPADATATTIGGHAARVWRSAVGDTVTTTVLWSPAAGQRYRLMLLDQTDDPMDEADVVGIARTVG